MKLSEKEWQEFDFNALKLEVINSKAYHLANVEEDDTGVAYLTRTKYNNSFNMCVKNNALKINPANTISFGAESAHFFYQPFRYITGNKMYYIKNGKINKFIGLFLQCSLQSSVESCFSFGNGMIPERIKKKKIVLPVDANGDPDWNFMEKYITGIEKQKEKDALIFIKTQLNTISYADLIKLDEKEWKPFPINKIFKVLSGKRLESYNMVAGERPFIGATDSGNGITNYISNENDSLDKNVLGVNYNGNGMAISFYHPYECIFSDDVKRFHLKEYPDNKYVLLFFKAIILQQKPKYNYGYKFNGTRMKRQIIMLPVNDAGNPDYEYMEQYIKNLMIKKYKAYLEYAEK